MKLHKITVYLLLVCGITLAGIAFVALSKNKDEFTAQIPAKKCECGPAEHWYQKSCIKNYNKQFPDAQLPENNDTEGLLENIVQAIDMLATNIKFIDENGLPLQLELNKKGILHLPLSKNPDFKLFKQILRNVDLATTLTAQDLYEHWNTQLNSVTHS